MFKSEKFEFIKNPVICAITCTFKVENQITYDDISNLICKALNNSLEDKNYVLHTKITKEKTQLHIPIGIQLNGHEVLFRCRYINYTQNGRLRSNFRNQICLYYINDSKKKRCYKFFCNGNIHVTGYNDMVSMDTELKILYEGLHILVGSKESSFTIFEKHIHMINLSFKLSTTINLIHVQNKIYTKQWMPVYEPEIYCALVLHAESFKAIIFKSGSIILTGCKSIESLHAGFVQLLDFFNKNL